MGWLGFYMYPVRRPWELESCAQGFKEKRPLTRDLKQIIIKKRQADSSIRGSK